MPLNKFKSNFPFHRRLLPFKVLSIAAFSSLLIIAHLPITANATELTPINPNFSKSPNYESSLWGLSAIRTNLAQSVTTGNGVVVAVIDTGVDATHPDLLGRVLAGWSTITGKAFAFGASTDGGEHGTHVAGIIAGSLDQKGIAGVAPDSFILPVQVLDSNGSGSDKSVAEGIDWATLNGANVINLSLGGSTNPFAYGGSKSCAAVGRAFNAGVVVIVAAGNAGGAGNPKNEPASCKGALSVAAVDENLNRSSFSSFDASVAISAPGTSIISSTPTFNRHPFAQWDGTSMAAPFVAGVAALVRSAHPDWSAQQVVDALIASVVDLGPVGSDPEYGAGLVDAASALGLPRQQRSDVITAIGVSTTPTVLTAQSDGSTIVVRWDSPKHSIAKSFEISSTTGETTERYVSPGNVGTISIPSSLFPDYVVVSALYDDGIVRYSLPFYDILDNRKFESSKHTTVITKVTASWSPKGLNVTYATKGPLSDVRVSLNSFAGNFFIYETIKSNLTSKTYPLAADDPARGQSISISVSTELGGKEFMLAPQYSITARSLTAGNGWFAVTGSTNEACRSQKKIGCSGTLIELKDVKTGKVIAKSWVLANLTYGFYLPSKLITGPVFVSVGSFKSAPLRWKEA